MYKNLGTKIAQGCLTNSKHTRSLIDGVYPKYLTKGQGCYVWDEKKKKYIDFICGLGTNIIGYGHGLIADEISKRALDGASLSLATPLEENMADRIQEFFPWIEKIKFLKTGGEACAGSLKIARNHTKRKMVLSEGYHGWHQEFTSLTPPSGGCVEQPFIQQLTDLNQINDSIAAVIVEPVNLDWSDKRREWLKALRSLTKQCGVVLIFDEIVTGFRFLKHSVSEYFNIEPDLLLLGKAIANGMPLSAICGKSELMDHNDYFISSTYAGETLSLAAGLKTLELLQTTFKVDQLWAKGEYFLTAFNKLSKNLKIEGYPTRGMFIGDLEYKAKFWQETCNAGILFGPSWFLNYKHFDTLDWVLNCCEDIVKRIDRGEVTFCGNLPQSPYATKVRMNFGRSN